MLPIAALGLACVCPGGGLASEAEPFPPTAWLDADGRWVQHRGMNVSNASKYSADHLPGLTDAELDLLVTHGITLARYLVFWSAIEPERGKPDMAYVDAAAADIARLTSRGIDVLVDMHQDLWGVGFGGDGAPLWTCDSALYKSYDPPDGGWFLGYTTPEVQECFDRFWESDELQDDYARAWETMAAAVEGDGGVVAFDLMNEPFFGTFDATTFETEVLPDFYARVARALPRDRLVVIEPSIAINVTGVTELPVPEGDATWGFGPHYYPPYAELGTGYDGDFADEDERIAAYAAAAEEREMPMLLGEFGIFSNFGNEPDYVRSMLDAVAVRGGSAAYWSYERGDGWQPLTAEGEPGPGLDGFDRPYLHRTPGPFDLESVEPLRFTVEGGPARAPVEVVVPGDCTPVSDPPGDFDAGRRVLRWDAPSGDAMLDVRVEGCG